MSRHLDALDRLFADMDDAGELLDLDARQTEALRKAAADRKARRTSKGEPSA
jgi:hypothetical protein